MLKINGKVLFLFLAIALCVLVAGFMFACGDDDDDSEACDEEQWDTCEDECNELFPGVTDPPAVFACFYQCVPDNCEIPCESECIHQNCEFMEFDQWHDCTDECGQTCDEEYDSGL
jgi:hypothetical protein